MVPGIDPKGRLFNVEMQMNLVPALPERLVYYWAQLYSHQLVVGEAYTQLCPTISICFLNQVLYADAPEFHHVFGMLERERHTVLTHDFPFTPVGNAQVPSRARFTA